MTKMVNLYSKDGMDQMGMQYGTEIGRTVAVSTNGHTIIIGIGQIHNIPTEYHMKMKTETKQIQIIVKRRYDGK